MADRSAIEWTDATWNPARGCTRVSPGCENCYAERIAARFSGPGQPYEGLATRDPPRWTREVRLIEAALTIPLHWRRPRRVFVNSMSDLFHESLTIHDIAKCLAIMALARQHTYQVLTKRPGRMRELLSATAFWDGVNSFMDRLAPAHWHDRELEDAGGWPLANVWLGVSVEDQARAEERIPLLLDTPASVRFVSYEPALGPLDLTRIAHENGRPDHYYHSLDGYVIDGSQAEIARIHWVIGGGESGPGARPCHPDWIRSIRDQCQAARVPFFFKQWGGWYWVEDMIMPAPPASPGRRDYIRDSCGRTAIRSGKKAAGRLLDGREWNEFPT